ncbi:hypothetical protein Z042_02435 [Chania multitudinisentens RB-25]|uniref:Uncharacterized protein n=1 Tax=Chania multitudinisentens RB-25 TaxID=1441930 RepID=W0L4A8_9GAMM|nr:hypothetical protein [Chania multitudinisentens]AHG18603.1 hypothetical protein Z042_02435 [Chania multitudinisentens RB-25]
MKIDASKPRCPVGSITENGRYTIYLTGPNSHLLIREAGVGSLAIGPSSLGKKVNLRVEPDECLDWTVFDAFATPAGYPWPRFLSYTGNDNGFFNWANERQIETMSWYPVLSGDIAVDASRSKFQTLQIELNEPDGRLHLTLPRREFSPYFRLCLHGDLARFTADGALPRTLELVPRTGPRRSDTPYLLPDLGVLHTVTELELRNGPMAQPISLACLDHFPNLKSLSLWGNFTNLEALAEQSQLEALALRFMPDLTELSPLSAWPHLNSFIAFNIEETAGKRLRQQLKARSTVRAWTGHVGVSQLRKSEWWESEFGRPFSAWLKRLAKVANEAYDVALKALTEAQTIAEAQMVFTTFAMRLNVLKGIETTERDDLSEAVWQLSQSAPAVRLGISEEMAQRWFDDARDY